MVAQREACDRCHQLKTRCVRHAHSQVCIRCARLRITCTYGPPDRRGRPSGASKRRASQGTARPWNKDEQSHTGCGPTPSSPSVEDFTTIVVDENLSQVYDRQPSLEDELFLEDHSQLQPSLYPQDLLPLLSHPEATSTDLDILNPAQEFNLATSSNDQVGASVADHDNARGSLDSSIDSSQSLFSSLMETQNRLARHSRLLTSGCGLNSIGAIHQDCAKVAQMLENADRELSLPAELPRGSLALLLVSCYFSMIHTYSLLIERFHKELGIQESQTEGQHHTVAASNTSGEQSGHSDMPYISIGRMQVTLPKAATLKINIEVVMQAAQHAKDSIHRSITRFRDARGLLGASGSQRIRSGFGDPCSCHKNGASIDDFVLAELTQLQRHQDTFLAGIRDEPR